MIYKIARYIGWNNGLESLLNKLKTEAEKGDTQWAKDNLEVLHMIRSADKVDFWVDDEGATIVLYREIDND